jgi:hypothetical protein
MIYIEESTPVCSRPASKTSAITGRYWRPPGGVCRGPDYAITPQLTLIQSRALSLTTKTSQSRIINVSINNVHWNGYCAIQRANTDKAAGSEALFNVLPDSTHHLHTAKLRVTPTCAMPSALLPTRTGLRLPSPSFPYHQIGFLCKQRLPTLLFHKQVLDPVPIISTPILQLHSPHL